LPPQGSGFDWWKAPGRTPPQRPAPAAVATGEQAQGPEPLPNPAPEPEPEPEPEPQPEPEAESPAVPVAEPFRTSHAEVYRLAHEGEEFREIRSSYRRFVFPACAVFIAWYLLYIIAAVTLPGLMARPVAGPFNVAWLMGLLQFLTTFLITWLYARHARDRRDRAALGLRWDTQDRLR
jgi:uncharacterized membrane protein (DUF485 family)